MIIDYLLHTFIQFGITALLALGLTFTLGVVGLVHLGYLALAGVGAYASAILLTTWHVPFVPALLAGAILGAAVGWVVALPTRDVRGDAFALATFATAWVFLVASSSWVSLTGGPQGVVGIPRPSFALLNRDYLLLVAALLVAAYAALQRVTTSPFGRLLGAIRDDELAARVFGKRTVAAKRTALVLAGTVAGLAGGLHASFLQFLHPTMFWLPMLLMVLTAVILGGVGSHAGALAGLAVLTMLTEALRNAPLPEEHFAPLRLIGIALVLLLVLLLRPRGILGRIDFQ